MIQDLCFIDAIVDAGGDIVTGYFQGNFAAIAKTFKLKRDTVVKVWRQFVATDHELPKSTATGVRSLQPNDLDFIEFLKTDRPLLTSGEFLREVNECCQIPGVSTVTIDHAVRKYMHKGEWSRTRMTRPAAKKFTHDNVAYCEAFVNYISTVDP